jgi:hypothetical protein
MSPEKETGAISHAPIPKPTVQYAACVDSATVIKRMPEGHTHYAVERCVDCGRHLRWMPRPENVERRRLNAIYLARLALCKTLNGWERNFLCHVSQRRKLSPRQQEIVDELAAKHPREALP